MTVLVVDLARTRPARADVVREHLASPKRDAALVIVVDNPGEPPPAASGSTLPPLRPGAAPAGLCPLMPPAAGALPAPRRRPRGLPLSLPGHHPAPPSSAHPNRGATRTGVRGPFKPRCRNPDAAATVAAPS